MKTYLLLALAAVIITVESCKKDKESPCENTKCAPPARKVHFELYTNENFAGEKKNITFRIFMRNHTRTILDSSLATMKVEEIPDFNHRIIIEKFVPRNDTSTLVVGFIYYLENVGESWYLEDFPSGNNFKVLTYPFR
ncbi:MAG: hypothetical protein ABIN89_09225 [Chitinophagaceae bacterium]